MNTEIQTIADALREDARKMGCAPTFEAIRAKYGEHADDVIGDWTIEALASTPKVRDEYVAALERGDDAAYCALDRQYLTAALELAAAGPHDPDCDECHGTGKHTGFLTRTRCQSC